MAEDIKGLIEKIQQDGIKAAEEKAAEIESRALRQANEIVEKARQEADKIIKDAQDRIAQMQEASRASLKQAGRNLLLDLRKEIDTALGRVISTRVHDALSPGELAKIIMALVKDYSGKDKADIVILAKKEDLERLEKGFLHELREAAKKGITLMPQEEISGGFIISYDGGKSHFDFTDKALAEYLSRYLKPKLAEILKH